MAWTAEEALIHHGILGQKWGRRNGPPYPLGASDHSAAEKKAGWRKSLNKKGWSASKAIVDMGSSQAVDSRTGFKVMRHPMSTEENARLANRDGFRENCREVTAAFAQRELFHLDVVAKDKQRRGNLHDFINQYFEEGDRMVRSVSVSADNAQRRVEKQILKHGKEGDVGAVGLEFAPQFVVLRVKINEFNKELQPFATTFTTIVKGMAAEATKAINGIEIGSKAFITGSTWEAFTKTGLASEQFREAIMESAREHGVAVDKMVSKNGGFAESLKEGWLNSDILSDALDKLGGTTQIVQRDYEDWMGCLNQSIASNKEWLETVVDQDFYLKTFGKSAKEAAAELDNIDFDTFKDQLIDAYDTYEGVLGKMPDYTEAQLRDMYAAFQDYLGDRGALDVLDEFEASAYDAHVTVEELAAGIEEFANGADLSELVGMYDKLTDKEKDALGITKEQIEMYVQIKKHNDERLAQLQKLNDWVCSR